MQRAPVYAKGSCMLIETPCRHHRLSCGLRSRFGFHNLCALCMLCGEKSRLTSVCRVSRQMKKNLLNVAITAVAVALSPPGVTASGSQKPAKGFSGWIQAGIGYSTSTDQLDTDADKRNDGLGSNADRYHDVVPMLLFDLRYTLSPSGRQVYFGTPLESGGPPGVTLGAVLPFDDIGKLDAAVFGKPFEEVWKDPYITSERRSDTAKATYGVKFTLSDILGTPTEMSYSFAHTDVDDDDIGKRFGSLERDGWLHKAGVEYGFPLGRGLSVVPGFEFSLADLDGNANSYKGYELKLGLRKYARGYRLNLTAGIGLNDYDSTHPIFDENRDDVIYSAFGVFTLSDLLGREYLFSSLIAGYQHRDSDIGFLNADGFIGGLTVGYKF